ncbi:unnamed protein product [Caenorhabditis auriculariae]|uniref:DUF7930 domain-containing protein n=1 Tax=Caenorhabditis auriculariae TaxID=2777116 RepID=A0A8S1HNR4_9PELO|nr:unnamed protein product [Caenorhabditis auriculariae]
MSRVDVKFAYIASDKLGTIYAPLATAVATNEYLPNLTLRYKVGDLVHVIAQPQNSKNGCGWLACKVRHVKSEVSASSPEPSPTKTKNEAIPVTSSSSSSSVCKEERAELKIVTDDEYHLASVHYLSETLAYAMHESLGAIFVPGCAFGDTAVKRLNAYLNVGDQLLLQVESQNEVNGCRWRAVHAVPYTAHDSHLSGYGRIMELSEYSCLVFSAAVEDNVYCNILTYTGGDDGKNAEKLTDVLSSGDVIIFTAEFRDNCFRANDWYPIKKNRPKAQNKNAVVKPSVDSFTQTIENLEVLVLRTFESKLPDLLKDKPTLLEEIQLLLLNEKIKTEAILPYR